LREFLLQIVSKNNFITIFHISFTLCYFFYSDWYFISIAGIEYCVILGQCHDFLLLQQRVLKRGYTNVLLQCWSHRYEDASVVITKWLTVSKYQFLKCQFIFSFLCVVIFSFISHGQNYYRIWLWLTHVHLSVVHLIVSNFYYT
jgi:hypothetical protein